jgi:tetratricopeptide (TPR) repeat protein
MKSMTDKKFNKIVLGVCLAIIVIVVLSVFAFGIMFSSHNNAARLPVPGTPAWDRLNKSMTRISAESDQVHKAYLLEKDGKFKEAINEYEKAVEITKNGGSEFMAREGLSICYEKDKQFENALQQLDWLIARQPRAEVLNEFKKRKADIQKMIQEDQSNK